MEGNYSQEGDAAFLETSPFLGGNDGTLGRGRVGVGGDYALPESLHILNALVRVVEQVFKEPEKC